MCALDSVLSLAILPDGRRLAVGTDRGAKVFDPETGSQQYPYDRGSGFIRSVALSPDGEAVLGGVGTFLNVMTPCSAELRNVASGALTETFAGHTGPIVAVAFAPDGLSALTGSADNIIRVWNAGTNLQNGNRPIGTFTGHTGCIVALQCDLQRGWLLSGGTDGIRIWDLRARQPVRQFGQEIVAVFDQIAFSADGSRALTFSHGTAGKLLRLWDTESGQELKRLSGQSDWVGALALSKDGRLALCGSRGGSTAIQLWDTQQGQVLHQFEGHRGDITALLFHPDGRRALSGSADGYVRLWNLPAPAPFDSWSVEDRRAVLALDPNFIRLRRTMQSRGVQVIDATGRLTDSQAAPGDDLICRLSERELELIQAYYGHQKAAQACDARGDCAGAIKAYQQMVNLAPWDAIAAMSIGVSYAQQKDFSQALPWLERAAQIDPQNARVQKNLHAVHAAAGR